MRTAPATGGAIKPEWQLDGHSLTAPFLFTAAAGSDAVPVSAASYPTDRAVVSQYHRFVAGPTGTVSTYVCLRALRVCACACAYACVCGCACACVCVCVCVCLWVGGWVGV
jgi:hypothetical protein